MLEILFGHGKDLDVLQVCAMESSGELSVITHRAEDHRRAKLA